MLIWGGDYNGVAQAGGGAYDPATDTWTDLAGTNALALRFGHAAVCTAQEMLVLGGTTGSTELLSGWACDLAAKRWWPLSISGNPLPRTEATACWTGSEVLVFGGRAKGQPLASLQRLVPQPACYFYRKL